MLRHPEPTRDTGEEDGTAHAHRDDAAHLQAIVGVGARLPARQAVEVCAVGAVDGDVDTVATRDRDLGDLLAEERDLLVDIGFEFGRSITGIPRKTFERAQGFEIAPELVQTNALVVAKSR